MSYYAQINICFVLLEAMLRENGSIFDHRSFAPFLRRKDCYVSQLAYDPKIQETVRNCYYTDFSN